MQHVHERNGEEWIEDDFGQIFAALDSNGTLFLLFLRSLG